MPGSRMFIVRRIVIHFPYLNDALTAFGTGMSVAGGTS